VLGFLSKKSLYTFFRISKRGYTQLVCPIRCPNPKRDLPRLLNAKQRHSEKGSRPEPKLLRQEIPERFSASEQPYSY